MALGLNHQTAPINIREVVVFAPEQLGTALKDLLTRGIVYEAAILSTCNRTEIYCNLSSIEHVSLIIQWLGNYYANNTDLTPYLYKYAEHYAVQHILRVASGLDSLILGEPQILGQVKAAYQAANQAGTLGPCLERLFQYTFSVAKKIRTNTKIGMYPISIAFTAVGLAKQIFADLPKRTALLIGAGSTIALVIKHLRESSIGRIIIANRKLEHAVELLSENSRNYESAIAINLYQLPQYLTEADIIVSATTSPSIILEVKHVKDSLKKRRRPILLLDLAVPRDIDPTVSQIEDIYLYTVDDLGKIIQDNFNARQSAAQEAELIINKQVDEFMGWLRSLNYNMCINKLRQQAELLKDQVLARAIHQIALGKDPKEVICTLAHLLTNKLIHPPCVGLREAATRGDIVTLEVIKSLYHLDGGYLD